MCTLLKLRPGILDSQTRIQFANSISLQARCQSERETYIGLTNANSIRKFYLLAYMLSKWEREKGEREILGLTNANFEFTFAFILLLPVAECPGLGTDTGLDADFSSCFWNLSLCKIVKHPFHNLNFDCVMRPLL